MIKLTCLDIEYVEVEGKKERKVKGEFPLFLSPDSITAVWQPPGDTITMLVAASGRWPVKECVSRVLAMQEGESALSAMKSHLEHGD